jgi:hypothetical protein
MLGKPGGVGILCTGLSEGDFEPEPKDDAGTEQRWIQMAHIRDCLQAGSGGKRVLAWKKQFKTINHG